MNNTNTTNNNMNYTNHSNDNNDNNNNNVAVAAPCTEMFESPGNHPEPRYQLLSSFSEGAHL